MFEFRITKYDPAYRDDGGAYMRNEWTSASHVGQSFGGVVLSEAEYQRVENAYSIAAIAFLREAGVSSLVVAGLENPASISLPFAEGATLPLAEIEGVVRHMLREDFWCRLEGEDAFLHIGWDYYMFVGVPVACPAADTLARHLGLFVEPFRSPYHE